MTTAGHGLDDELQRSSLWDPAAGRFDPRLLRAAIVRRGLTPGEFGRDAGVGRTTVYRALAGAGVRDRTAIRIMVELSRRPPLRLEGAW